MLPASDKHGRCELCDREPIRITRHHLVPVSQGGRGGPLADLCAACHRQIHVLFTTAELLELRSVARLRDHPAVQKYLAWVRRQPPETGVRVRRGRRRRE
ncbi:MAG: HNH endonuclease [Anaerolineae bacterium]|nr:HNH endonuclease [Anaerolineae bacterium]